MSDKVVDLGARRVERGPHHEGKCRCLDCGHVWVAVRPVSSEPEWLECPSCGRATGRPTGAYERAGPTWVCNCGNDLFQIMPGGAYCPSCAAWFTPDDAVGQMTDWAREQADQFHRELAASMPGAGFGTTPGEGA